MACNAWNHKPECQCKFRGGHANSTPPRRATWAAKSYSSYIRQTHQVCEKCGATVFFIKFKNGGGAFFDRLGRPWTRHGCLKAEEAYDPFTKKRVPRLKLIKSEYERDGWTPLFNVRLETDMLETVISGLRLDASNLLRCSVDEQPFIDRTALIYYRDDPTTPGNIELDYFDEVTGIPKTLSARRLI